MKEENPHTKEGENIPSPKTTDEKEKSSSAGEQFSNWTEQLLYDENQKIAREWKKHPTTEKIKP